MSQTYTAVRKKTDEWKREKHSVDRFFFLFLFSLDKRKVSHTYVTFANGNGSVDVEKVYGNCWAQRQPQTVSIFQCWCDEKPSTNEMNIATCLCDVQNILFFFNIILAMEIARHQLMPRSLFSSAISPFKSNYVRDFDM